MLANLTPGHQATWVDYRNDDRAPLLFISGGKDHIMPAEVTKENAERYEKSAAHKVDHASHAAAGWHAM